MRAIAILVILMTGIVLPESAWALDRACRHDKDVCLQQARRKVVFRLNDGCSLGGGLQACIAVVQSAIQAWNQPECSDMELVYDGTTPRTDIGYDTDEPQGNLNLILVLESVWPYGRNERRVTTLTYDDQTGDIVDFDVEINAVEFDLDRAALHNVLAREFGRALGFEYSQEPASIMYEMLEDTEEQRTLSEADAESLCLFYPASSPGLPTGCSCMATSRPEGFGNGIAGLFALVAWGARRARRQVP